MPHRIAAISLPLVFGILLLALQASAVTQVTIEPGANQYCQDMSGQYKEDWNCDIGTASPQGEQYICLRGKYCVGYIPKQIFRIRGHCKLHLECSVEEYFESGKWQPAKVPGKGIPATGPVSPTTPPADANVSSVAPLLEDPAYIRCSFGYGDCASTSGGSSASTLPPSTATNDQDTAMPAQSPSGSSALAPGEKVNDLQPLKTVEQELSHTTKDIGQTNSTFGKQTPVDLLTEAQDEGKSCKQRSSWDYVWNCSWPSLVAQDAWGLVKNIGDIAQGNTFLMPPGMRKEDFTDNPNAPYPDQKAFIDVVKTPLYFATGGLTLGGTESAIGIFGGKMLITSTEEGVAALAVAEQMALKGATKEEIIQSTGLFKGANGEWMTEISDAGARWIAPLTTARQPLGAVLDHPELYSAYPQMAEISIASKNSMIPWLASGGDRILLNDYYLTPAWLDRLSNSPIRPIDLFGRSAVDVEGQSLSLTLHECQHCVQAIEGWPTTFGAFMGRNYYNSFPEVQAVNVQARTALSETERATIYPWITQSVPDAKQIVSRSWFSWLGF